VGGGETTSCRGRLDGAERIVSALLPGNGYKEERKELIEKAQLAILEEEVLVEDRDQVLQLIADALSRADSTAGNEAALRPTHRRTRIPSPSRARALR
jgi:hypothetical protein